MLDSTIRPESWLLLLELLQTMFGATIGNGTEFDNKLN